MGEFRVHQIRFFDYEPSAIHCMAYDENHQKLAVSRSVAYSSNGPNGHMTQ